MCLEIHFKKTLYPFTPARVPTSINLIITFVLRFLDSHLIIQTSREIFIDIDTIVIVICVMDEVIILIVLKNVSSRQIIGKYLFQLAIFLM